MRLGIYNSGWEYIDSEGDLDNGDGLTEELEAGETYYIRVEYYKDAGSYTLNIGQKKEIVDITDYTSISDSIQYTNQKNDYLYVAKDNGTYRFEFSDVPNGTDMRLGIYNSGWEQINSEGDLDNDDGLTEELEAGESYYIRVEYYRDVGSYTLNVGQKKEVVDITNYVSVSDSMQYTCQENDYSYVAESEGTYKFEISDIQKGHALRIEVFNSGWESVTSNYVYGKGEGVEVSLSSGELCFIRVVQNSGKGNYTLTLGK